MFVVVTLSAPSNSTDTTQGNTSPRGALSIMNAAGEPLGFLNAEEVTAFRTALASSLLLSRRTHLKTLTVFGAGKQAFWHIRLALLLRGHTIKTVYIINRSFADRSKNLMRSLFHVDHEKKISEGWENTKFSMLSPSYGEYARLLKEQIRAADAIITTVPSTAPLFDPLILASTEGRRKGRLVIAVGSYKPHMIELPVEILHQAVKSAHEHRHFHKHAVEGGVVVVDSLTACLKEAGEVIQAGLTPHQLVELGELVMLEGQTAAPPSNSSSETLDDTDFEKLRLSLREDSAEGSMASVMREDSFSSTNESSKSRRSGSFSRLSRRSSRERHARSSSTDSRGAPNQEDAMSKWLSQGNVIYKSVGLGLMDLVVGGELVKLAHKKKIGTTIDQF